MLLAWMERPISIALTENEANFSRAWLRVSSP